MRILITGATGGIGYAVARELIKKGHSLYLGTHTKKQMLMLQDKLEEEQLGAICLKIDVTCSEDIEKVSNLDIDCLINHAGIGISGSLLYMDIDRLRENYEVNIFSSFRLLKRVYQNMEKNHIKGKLFVTSSVAAYLPFPFLWCYTSSKAAITMLCRTIKKELEYLKHDISISVIEPGAYYTGFNQVMIDNKSKYLEKGNVLYDNLESINRLQRNMFRIIEKDDYSDLVSKVVSAVNEKRPKFMIRRPLSTRVFLKL